MLATLAQGVERGEFRVVYQPIVELADGRVRGVEALVRWEHPTLGYLPRTSSSARPRTTA